MNSLSISGYIATDIRHSISKNGFDLCWFLVAVKRPGKPKVKDVFPVVAWRTNAKYAHDYLQKGQKVEILGYLTSKQSQSGAFLTEIVVQSITSDDYRQKHSLENKEENESIDYVGESIHEEKNSEIFTSLSDNTQPDDDIHDDEYALMKALDELYSDYGR